MRVKRVAVIGAGWSGAAAARQLHDEGVINQDEAILQGLLVADELLGSR